MKVFLITFGIATLLILLCFVGLGIGRLLTGRSKLSCKRCGTPEKTECSVCKKKPDKN